MGAESVPVYKQLTCPLTWLPLSIALHGRNYHFSFTDECVEMKQFL